ncbi:MAG: YiiX/YebB-like N1pC/P60 family cysteine hydrolase [Gammaproteobacteria bacterium]|nr:YiiX/YebB-like N1pC/P60 family cysteine hydrolase [Gammaproteobacteria bacterium]
MSLFNFFAKPVISFLNQEQRARDFPLSDYERICFELKLCDVLLVEGRTRVSNVIRRITMSPWTHAALYIGRIHDIEDPELQKVVRHHYKGDDGDRLIIESLLGHGTVIRHLKVYEKDHLRICRPSRLAAKDAQQVIRFALSRLGIDYDIRQILDLARLLFPWVILPKKWRSTLFNYHPGRPTRTVCSTMIAEAFAFVQFPILPLVKRAADGSGKVQLFRRNPKLTTPSDFDYSPYFEIIKYPFIDFTHEKDYHLLPWHGSQELAGEEAEYYLNSDMVHTEIEVQEALGAAIKSAEEGETHETPKAGSSPD